MAINGLRFFSRVKSCEMTPQNPPGFIIETEATKAAFQNGYQRQLGWQNGWGQFASTTVPGTIFIGAASTTGPYLLSQNQPGAALQTLPTLTALHASISWIYDNPTPILEAFTALTAPLPARPPARPHHAALTPRRRSTARATGRRR